MVYNTGNPIGSTDPRDAADNKENFDQFAVSTARTYTDRLGVERKTLQGMEYEFSAFIASLGYEFVGDYAPGIELTGYQQILRDTSGEFWRLSGSVTLPYTTTGTGLPEGGNFVAVGDAALRQDLSDQDKGAAMVARGVVAVDSITDLLALPEGQRKEGLRYLVKGYHPGSSVGGGEFFWSASGTKSAHDGIQIFDPGRVVGTPDDPSWYGGGLPGTGVFVRRKSKIDTYDCGALDAPADSWAAIRAGFESQLPLTVSGEIFAGADIRAQLPSSKRISFEQGAVIRMGHSAKGSYNLIDTTGTTDVELLGLRVTSDGDFSLEETSDGTTSKQCVRFESCTHIRIADCYIYDWYGYYGVNADGDRGEDVACVFLIADSSFVDLENLQFRNCKREYFMAVNTTDMVLDGFSGYGPHYTALKQLPWNPEGDTNTSRRSVIRNVIVEGALGSAVDLGGDDTLLDGVVVTNSRKGIDVNTEQFLADPDTPMNGKVTIRNATITLTNQPDGYGVQVIRARRAVIDNVHIFNGVAVGLRMTGVVEASVTASSVTDCTGAPVALTGNAETSRNSLRVSGLDIFGATSAVALSLSRWQVAQIDGVTIYGASISLDRMGTAFISSLVMRGFAVNSPGAAVSISNTGGRISLSGFDVQPGGAYSGLLIYASSATSVDFLHISNGRFGESSNNYACNVPGLTKGSYDNVEHSCPNLIYSDITRVTTVNATGGNNSYRFPVDLGNGYLWVDSSGVVRVSSSYPTGDTAGVPVGGQS